MENRSGMRAAVYGKSGGGKSWYVKKVILPALKRVVVFDPEEDFEDEPNMLRIDTKAELLEVLRDCWDGSFRIAYVPKAMNEMEELHDVSLLIERLQEPYKRGEHDGKTTLIVDELNTSFPLTVHPRFQGFARICSKGRKRGINVVGITQRPAEVSTRFRGNLDAVSCFRLSLDGDYAAVAQYVGANAKERLDNAPEFSSLKWEGGDIELVPPT